MHGVNLAAFVRRTTRRFQPTDPMFGLFTLGIGEGEFLEIRPGGFRPSCEGVSLKINGIVAVWSGSFLSVCGRNENQRCRGEDDNQAFDHSRIVLAVVVSSNYMRIGDV